MGYPSELQVLIVEDDPGSKSYYDAVFDAQRKMGTPIAPVRYAFCHSDGVEALAANRIYHLVILDLRLPPEPGEPAADGVDFGVDLLKRCAERNEYPIPVALVASGHLDKTRQGDLQRLVVSSFAHAQVLSKGVSLEQEINSALKEVRRYVEFGIHVRDGGRGTFPTISPRDEDLLRRAIGLQEAIGVDVRWWSAEHDPSVAGDSTYRGWTKTLMGSFLLPAGRGLSRPSFFKLTPNAALPGVAKEANLLEQKLSHVKVLAALSAGDRGLLVTQKVGDGDDPPISLMDFLGQEAATARQIGGLVTEIADQVRRLGDALPDQREVARLLWPYHDPNRISEQWTRFNGERLVTEQGATWSAPALFERLSSCRKVLRIGVQSALHGDLNPTNVALDVGAEVAHAFIFDASGGRADINLRDLAMLEVTAILHQAGDDTPEDLVSALGPLYESSELRTGEPPLGLSPRARNTWRMIVELRHRAMSFADATKESYAILLFDNALIQLGGLAFSAFNKIRVPEHAVHLAARIAGWLAAVAPEMCAPGATTVPASS